MKTTKKILGRLVSTVAHHDKNLWWELKRQIFDFGYQAYYPGQQEFVFAARQSLMNLSDSDQKVLVDECRSKDPKQEGLADTEILLTYVPVIIEHVVERARSAADRTENW